MECQSNETKEGYFDDVVTIFKTHNHPIILVEEAALRWMGVRVMSPDLDLLVRNDEIQDIVRSFSKSGSFQLVDQDLSLRFHDSYAKQVPRFHVLGLTPRNFFQFVSLWSESVYKLRVEDATIDGLCVPDVLAWNPTVVDERFGTVPETARITPTGRNSERIPFLPLVRFSTTEVAIITPTVPKLCDAMFGQIRYRRDHPEDFPGVKANGRPSYHLSNLTRYLHLEKPSQREVLITLLIEDNQAEMESRLHKFKRKRLITSSMISLIR